MKNEIIRDLVTEMRWRRDTESRLLGFYLAGCIAQIALLVQTKGKGCVYEVLVVLFVVLITFSIGNKFIDKILKENKIYKLLGETVTAHWNMLKLFDAETDKPGLPIEFKAFGKGEGYKSTVAQIRFAQVITILVSAVWLLVIINERFDFMRWFCECICRNNGCS